MRQTLSFSRRLFFLPSLQKRSLRLLLETKQRLKLREVKDSKAEASEPPQEAAPRHRHRRVTGEGCSEASSTSVCVSEQDRGSRQTAAMSSTQRLCWAWVKSLPLPFSSLLSISPIIPLWLSSLHLKATSNLPGCQFRAMDLSLSLSLTHTHTHTHSQTITACLLG